MTASLLIFPAILVLAISIPQTVIGQTVQLNGCLIGEGGERIDSGYVVVPSLELVSPVEPGGCFSLGAASVKEKKAAPDFTLFRRRGTALFLQDVHTPRRVTVLGLNGRSLGEVSQPGEREHGWTLPRFAALSVLRIQSNQRVYNIPVLPEIEKSIGTILCTARPRAATSVQRRKNMADTLYIDAQGYRIKTIPLSSHEGDLGTITLRPDTGGYSYYALLMKTFFLEQDRLPADIFNAFDTPAQLCEYVNEPYTCYVPPEYAENFRRAVFVSEGVGIGVRLDSAKTGVLVREVVTGSPANKAGMRVLDTIVAIDDTPVAGVPVVEVYGMLVKEPGTVVKISLRRPLSPDRTVEVTCEYHKTPTVFTDSISSTVSLIQITSFRSQTSAPGGTAYEFYRALAWTSGVPTVILDLRGNGGGEIDQCLSSLSMLLKKNAPCVRTRFRESGYIFKATTTDTIFNAPAERAEYALNRSFVVLADSLTASASELFLAALRSNRPDIQIIGDTTYGKGKGQLIIGGPDSGMIRITFMEMTFISGQSWDKTGISPDIVAHGKNPLEVALEQIEPRLAKRYPVSLSQYAHGHHITKPSMPLSIRIIGIDH
jgi:C-terminal peptidase prc